jgi:hypothetical protein
MDHFKDHLGRSSLGVAMLAMEKWNLAETRRHSDCDSIQWICQGQSIAYEIILRRITRKKTCNGWRRWIHDTIKETRRAGDILGRGSQPRADQAPQKDESIDVPHGTDS